MKKILWVGDSPDCPSGFGRATREILRHLDYRLGGPYDVTVLGINHRGDPPTQPYPLYAASASVGGHDAYDSFGTHRLLWMCSFVNPDVIVIQNDGWNIPFYVKRLRAKKPSGEYVFPQYAATPVVAAVAVDGKNFQGAWLDGVAFAVFWTDFALAEARAGGFEGKAAVIPLGVDRALYRPLDRAAVKARLPEELREAFIVGSVNRNQPRKRWDLTVKYFAEWVKAKDVRDAWLYLHTAPTGDTGFDVVQLARYYGVGDRLALVTTEVFYGNPEEQMAETYNAFDVCVSTTQGEGFGLPSLEAMACGVPCILPDWAGLGSWARGAAWLVPCPTTAVGPPYVNVVGGVVDQAAFTTALHALYANPAARENNAMAALERASEARFTWESVGARYVDAIDEMLGVGRFCRHVYVNGACTACGAAYHMTTVTMAAAQGRPNGALVRAYDALATTNGATP